MKLFIRKFQLVFILVTLYLKNISKCEKQIKYLQYNGLRSNIHKVFQGCEILNLLFLLAPWRISEKKNIKA